MVGAPKTISDLARLDANPIVTCTRCAWSVEYDRGRLIHLRTTHGLTLDWRGFCAETRCEWCGAPVRVTMKLFVGDAALREGDLRRKLVWKALCALAEAQADAEAGRVRASYGLRFALAYLYAVGRRSGEWFDREPYVEFWQLATQSDVPLRTIGYQPSASARGTAMQTCVNAIARAAGIELTPPARAALSKARHERRERAGGHGDDDREE